MKKTKEKIEIKQRPEPITRQENWNDYMCFLLEHILEELVKFNSSNSDIVKTKTTANKTNTKTVTKSKG